MTLIPSRPKHIPALDGIRFVAVMAVVVHHITGGSHATFLRHILGLQEGNGFGVTMFLLLSGMLLTGVLLDTRHVQNRYGKFMYRRCMRIFPLYYAYLAVAIALTWLFAAAPMHQPWVYLLFLQSTAPEQASHTLSYLPLYHLWTIAVQEQFYIVWPFLLWACKSIRQVRVLCWSIVVVSLIARLNLFPASYTWLTYPTHSLMARAGELSFGALLALEIRSASRLTVVLKSLLVPLLIGSVVWMWRGMDLEQSFGRSVGLLLLTVTCASVILMACDATTFISRTLSTRMMATWGRRYSYGIYMLHPAILHLSSNLHRGKGLTMALFGLGLACTVSLSYHLYEAHFLLKRVVPSPVPVVKGTVPKSFDAVMY